MSGWEERIDGVIGDGKKPFGNHPCDSHAAREMLRDAIAQGAGFNSYRDRIKAAYRKKLPDTPEGNKVLDDQMKRVESINSYFDHD